MNVNDFLDKCALDNRKAKSRTKPEWAIIIILDKL